MTRRAAAVRLVVMLGTSYFLVATQHPYDEGSRRQVCEHPRQAVAFQVVGSCGPQGEVIMKSLENDCAISVQGGGAVGLPSAGRFSSSGGAVVDLTKDGWTLSGYLSEGAPLPGGGAAPDAGIFGVESDAQPSTDVGVPPFGTGPDAQPPTVVHGTLVKRECYNSRVSPLSISCRDGTAASSCQATLIVR